MSPTTDHGSNPTRSNYRGPIWLISSAFHGTLSIAPSCPSRVSLLPSIRPLQSSHRPYPHSSPFLSPVCRYPHPPSRLSVVTARWIDGNTLDGNPITAEANILSITQTPPSALLSCSVLQNCLQIGSCGNLTLPGSPPPVSVSTEPPIPVESPLHWQPIVNGIIRAVFGQIP